MCYNDNQGKTPHAALNRIYTPFWRRHHCQPTALHPFPLMESRISARMLSCASMIWFTALPIHNTLTLSNSVFCFGWASPRPLCALHCGALVEPPAGPLEPDFFQHDQKRPQFTAAQCVPHCRLLPLPPHLCNTLGGTWTASNNQRIKQAHSKA